jgi:hypothetical protein
MRALLTDPITLVLLASIVWPLVGAVLTYLCRGFAKSEYPIVRRLFAGFSATTFDVPKLQRAVSQRPPMPSIVDVEPAPPTPRNDLRGVASVSAMALGAVVGPLAVVLLVASGCGWWTRNEPKVVHVVHAVDGLCDAAEADIVLPREARAVCMAADVADGLADRYEEAKAAGVTQEVHVELPAGEVLVVPAPDVATVVEQTPARKKRRKRWPRHVDGGTP